LIEIPIPKREPIKLVAYYKQFTAYYPQAEMVTKEWVVDNFQDDWTVFDCGANIGYYTILFAQLANKGKVYAFEPTNTFSMLEDNILYNNITNAVLEKKALGNKSGVFKDTIPIVWGVEEKEVMDAEAKKLCGYSQIEMETNEYEFITIDDYCKQHELDKVDCIKIDTDGFDFEILIGAKETMNRFSPVLIMEIYGQTLKIHGHNEKEVLDWLSGMGYKTCHVLDTYNYIMSKDGK
jgi:FkbM family methyltransferase